MAACWDCLAQQNPPPNSRSSASYPGAPRLPCESRSGTTEADRADCTGDCAALGTVRSDIRKAEGKGIFSSVRRLWIIRRDRTAQRRRAVWRLSWHRLNVRALYAGHVVQAMFGKVCRWRRGGSGQVALDKSALLKRKRMAAVCSWTDWALTSHSVKGTGNWILPSWTERADSNISAQAQIAICSITTDLHSVYAKRIRRP